ncbi:hypothetical protein HDU76_007843 [Blyttiomyces sp. JEL0837]|nr:hypothetical protein HDU76_007843 [Blyttiomyces sp. JEL0837]
MCSPPKRFVQLTTQQRQQEQQKQQEQELHGNHHHPHRSLLLVDRDDHEESLLLEQLLSMDEEAGKQVNDSASPTSEPSSVSPPSSTSTNTTSLAHDMSGLMVFDHNNKDDINSPASPRTTLCAQSLAMLQQECGQNTSSPSRTQSVSPIGACPASPTLPIVSEPVTGFFHVPSATSPDKCRQHVNVPHVVAPPKLANNIPVKSSSPSMAHTELPMSQLAVIAVHVMTRLIANRWRQALVPILAKQAAQPTNPQLSQSNILNPTNLIAATHLHISRLRRFASICLRLSHPSTPHLTLYALLIVHRILTAASASKSSIATSLNEDSLPLPLPVSLSSPTRLLLAGLILSESQLADAQTSCRVWAKAAGIAEGPAGVAKIKREALELLAYNVSVQPEEYEAWVVAVRKLFCEGPATSGHVDNEKVNTGNDGVAVGVPTTDNLDMKKADWMDEDVNVYGHNDTEVEDLHSHAAASESSRTCYSTSPSPHSDNSPLYVITGPSPSSSSTSWQSSSSVETTTNSHGQKRLATDGYDTSDDDENTSDGSVPPLYREDAGVAFFEAARKRLRKDMQGGVGCNGGNQDTTMKSWRQVVLS